MPILESELELYRSAVVNDGAANGGRMGRQRILCGVKNNLFPDVSQTQRNTGMVRRRKLFAALRNAEDLSLNNAYAHLDRDSEGDESYGLCAGTMRDTQADLVAPRLHAAARLKQNLSAGATSFQLQLKHPDLAEGFQSGDTLCLQDGTQREYFAAVQVAVEGLTLTVTLGEEEQTAHDYAAATAWGASVCLAPDQDLAPRVSDWDASGTQTGTYDVGAQPLELGNIGCVEDDWLLTFTGEQSFSVAGTFTGALGSGSLGADYAPVNPDGGVYFRLRAAGWGGIWGVGDTLRFSTHPAAFPLWVIQTVPQGAAATSASEPVLLVGGESA